MNVGCEYRSVTCPCDVWRVELQFIKAICRLPFTTNACSSGAETFHYSSTKSQSPGYMYMV